LEDFHPGHREEICLPQPELRFLPSAESDRRRYQRRIQPGKVVDFKEPLSTSMQLFPEYGRQVATDLQKQQFIHIQHCSQYAPIIREMNPPPRSCYRFRVGKFLPGTGQQIVAPGFRRDYRPDNVRNRPMRRWRAEVSFGKLGARQDTPGRS
jgi:hypothetical protein